MGAGLPQFAHKCNQFIQHDPIGCIAFNPQRTHIYSGGKGYVKVWDIDQSLAVSDLNVMVREEKIRAAQKFSTTVCTFNIPDSEEPFGSPLTFC